MHRVDWPLLLEPWTLITRVCKKLVEAVPSPMKGGEAKAWLPRQVIDCKYVTSVTCTYEEVAEVSSVE